MISSGRVPESVHLRDRLAALGLSQRGAARALGIHERTMRKYIAGDLPTPAMLWMALDSLSGHPPPSAATTPAAR